jgi:hypothetical protein
MHPLTSLPRIALFPPVVAGVLSTITPYRLLDALSVPYYINSMKVPPIGKRHLQPLLFLWSPDARSTNVLLSGFIVLVPTTKTLNL